MSKQKSKTLPAARFRVGDKVRVKHGFMDVDYPDMPLGGWAGTVTEVQEDDTFTVRWSKQTMGSIHPVFLQRCEIDGLDAEVYMLTGDDLEPDTGGPLDIGQTCGQKTHHDCSCDSRQADLRWQDQRTGCRMIIEKWLERYPDVENRPSRIRAVRGQWTTADGLKTEVVTVTIVAGDDIAEYDPEEDADPFEYWKAEARYWEAG